MDFKPIAPALPAALAPVSESPSSVPKAPAECKLFIPSNRIEGEALIHFFQDSFYAGCDQIVVVAANGSKHRFPRSLHGKSPTPGQMIFSFGEPLRETEDVVQIVYPSEKTNRKK